jgi:predicted CXXCH cytochrome family protein
VRQRTTDSGRRSRLAIGIACCLLSAVCCLAKNGAYKETAHADQSCIQCHGLHDTTCTTCHTDDSISRSAHARSLCNDCHDPHGVRDRDGVIPSMLVDRTWRLCGNCHDGILNALSESYPHAAACSDCHSAHKVLQDPAPSFDDPSDYRLAGVSRVQVVNGGAGVVPGYRLVAADDPGDPIEYEVCFKCHSSYAKKQRLGRTDLARLMNPANASSHQIACSKCHDPHGSAHRHLLKKSPDDLCAGCHSPAGHAQHARVQCTECHDPHGSVRNKALIGNRITTFMQTPVGGTCTSSCHGMRTYVR